jgi:hypothetical protein
MEGCGKPSRPHDIRCEKPQDGYWAEGVLHAEAGMISTSKKAARDLDIEESCKKRV